MFALRNPLVTSRCLASACSAFACLVSALLSSTAIANTIKSVRTHEAPDYIRVVLDTSKASKYSIFALENPHRIVIDVKRAKPAEGLLLESSKDLTYIKGLRGGSRDNGYRIVVDADVAFNPKFYPKNPSRHMGIDWLQICTFPRAGKNLSLPSHL